MNKTQLKKIIKEELQAALDENTESPYYAEQARLGKIHQMGHDDAVAGKEPSSTMAIYRVGYQAGMKSKKEEGDWYSEEHETLGDRKYADSRRVDEATPEEMDKYESDYFNENKTNKTKLKQLVKEELQAALEKY